VDRKRFDGLIRLTSAPDSHGVSLSGFIDPESDNADVSVRAEPYADLGEVLLEVRAEAEGHEPRDFTAPLTVEPAYWRSDYRRAPDAVVVQDVKNRKHYSAIDVVRGDIKVRFVLVVQDPAKDVKAIEDMPTFYIMCDKVWNELYGRFAAADPTKAGETWKQGGQKVIAGEMKDVGNDDGQLPALRMTVEEAYHCARWLGGNLPTTQQWDKASGYYRKDRGKGPFRVPDGRIERPKGYDWKPGEIAINRTKEGPMHVGEATCDESLYLCRDMAGNGCEWTRDLANDSNRPFPLQFASKLDAMVLRGKRYVAEQPWTFKNVDNWIIGGEVGNYLKPEPVFGFRVVIELN
jgi:hypothetical protein